MISDNGDSSADAILARARGLLNVSNDHQLSRLAGIPQTTISTWRVKNKPPYDFCAQISQRYGVSLDWLIFGIGLPRGGEASSIDIQLFDICLSTAERVNQSALSRGAARAAVVLYNSELSTFNAYLAGGMSRESALQATAISLEQRRQTNSDFVARLNGAA